MELTLPQEPTTTTDKIIKCLKFIYKVCIAANGALAFTNPVSAVIAGVGVMASVISASVKDKKIKPLMTMVNMIACNIDRAKNDKTNNS